ncbi:CobW family GTP-binding protein [Paralcaligenes ginsengisoli]|jgi:G3E family GTPase
MISSAQPIKLIVIGGYLGSGKTSLLNHILTHSRGKRITVLVNDFGQINIDAALIARRTQEVIALANGCICCTIGGELATALIRLGTATPRPEYLIIESSGVSNPGKIAQIGLLDKTYELDSIVVTVDAERIDQHLQDPYVGDMVAQQIRAAHLLLINKIDLIDSATKQKRIGLLKTVSGRQRLIETVNGAIAPELFFSPDFAPGARPEPFSRLADKPLSRVASFSVTTGDFPDKAQLERNLKSLPNEVLRAKGIVYFAADPRAFSVQVVGHRVAIKPVAVGADMARVSVLVFIGLQETMDQSGIESLIRHCD